MNNNTNRKYPERIIFLVETELKEKHQQMNEAGLNPSQILRNFLRDFPFQLKDNN
jgi:hypothetical protein